MRAAYFPAVLLATGIGWGATQPLGKIAASSGHAPFGLIFWQLVICVLVLGALTLVRGKRLALHPRALRFYLVVAVLGTLVPNFTFYLSVARLPAGIMSIVISAVPLIAFPLSVLLGMDRFGWRRAAGLGLGLTGVCLIAAPGAVLPDPSLAIWVPVALIGPLFYAMEGVFVARNGTEGLDAVQAMFGASVVGLVLCLPISLALGQFYVMRMPPGPTDWALIASSALHALLYATYVWMAARAGAVFASQTSYIVTAAGVIWAMLILNERFPPAVWLAAAVMLGGMFLVQPREKQAVAVNSD